MAKDSHRICSPHVGTWAVAFAFGFCVCFLPSSLLAQNQPQSTDSRTAQEEDIREAAFLFLFDIGTGPDPDFSFYCLSVNSNGPAIGVAPTLGDDPSEALLKRFPRIHRTLRKASECEILKKPKGLSATVRDKQSGKPAWMISLTLISWLNDKEVRVGGVRYCGTLCLWFSTLQAKLQDGKWKVGIAPDAAVVVSQDFSHRNLGPSPLTSRSEI